MTKPTKSSTLRTLDNARLASVTGGVTGEFSVTGTPEPIDPKRPPRTQVAGDFS